MILLPEDLEGLSRLPARLHLSDLPVPAAPFHPEDLLRLLHRPDLPGLEDRSRPEDQRRLSLPEDPEDLLHPSDLQAR